MANQEDCNGVPLEELRKLINMQYPDVTALIKIDDNFLDQGIDGKYIYASDTIFLASEIPLTEERINHWKKNNPALNVTKKAVVYLALLREVYNYRQEKVLQERKQRIILLTGFLSK